MKSRFSSAVARLCHPFQAEHSHSQLATCRACGKRKPIEDMSEIPFHGLFCNDDEANAFWNENYESKVTAERE